MGQPVYRSVQVRSAQAEYLAINPNGVVPTLVHDGAPIRESVIINEYIDAAFPGPALIPQPLKQARMREFIRTCEDDFDAIVKLTMANTSYEAAQPVGRRRAHQTGGPPADALLPGLHSRGVRENHDG